MKRLKIIYPVLLIVTFVSINTKAQTKEETEKWIVETVNKYMRADTLHHFTKTENGWVENSTMTETTPYSFAISNDSFYIKYRIMNIASMRFPIKPAKSKMQASYPFSSFTASAPVHSLEKLITLQKPANNDSNKYTGGSYLAMQYKEEIVFIKENDDEFSIKLTDLLPLFINLHKESGLIARLQEALEKLKTFYPKPKETF